MSNEEIQRLNVTLVHVDTTSLSSRHATNTKMQQLSLNFITLIKFQLSLNFYKEPSGDMITATCFSYEIGSVFDTTYFMKSINHEYMYNLN